jgi:hypothetical protein
MLNQHTKPKAMVQAAIVEADRFVPERNISQQYSSNRKVYHKPKVLM